jgi:hypothetical protein
LFIILTTIFLAFRTWDTIRDIKKNAINDANTIDTKIINKFQKDFVIKGVEYDYEEVITHKETLFGDIGPSIMMAKAEGKIVVGSTFKRIDNKLGEYVIALTIPKIESHDLKRIGDWEIDEGIKKFNNIEVENEIKEKTKLDIEKKVSGDLIYKCEQQNNLIIEEIFNSFGENKKFKIVYE